MRQCIPVTPSWLVTSTSHSASLPPVYLLTTHRDGWLTDCLCLTGSGKINTLPSNGWRRRYAHLGRQATFVSDDWRTGSVRLMRLCCVVMPSRCCNSSGRDCDELWIMTIFHDRNSREIPNMKFISFRCVPFRRKFNYVLRTGNPPRVRSGEDWHSDFRECLNRY